MEKHDRIKALKENALWFFLSAGNGWRRIMPRVKTAVAVAFDVVTGGVLCMSGAVLLLGYENKRMRGFVFLAATQILFISAIAFRNYWRRQLMIAQRGLLDKCEEQDRQVETLCDMTRVIIRQRDALERQLAAATKPAAEGPKEG